MARVSAGGAVGLASRGSAEARGWTIWLVVASWLGWEVVGLLCQDLAKEP